MKNKDNKLLNGIVLFISVILIFIGASLVKNSFHKEVISNKVLSNYEIKKDSAYAVYLKQNKFYDSNVLNSGKHYPSRLVDKIYFDLSYNIKNDKPADITYKYNVVADLIGNSTIENGTSNELWKKSYPLIKDTTNTVSNTKDFSLKEHVNIDYNYFNALASYFKTSYNLSISTSIFVTLNIDYTMKPVDSNKEKKFKDSIKLEIPLNDNITEVKESYEKTSKGNIILTSNDDISSNIETSKLIVGILMVLVSVAIAVYILVKQNITSKNLYQKHIDSILHDYDDLIVTVLNLPDFSHLKVMKISLVDDLVDVAEQNNTNIIHYETIKGEESILLVISGEYAFLYTVTSEDIRRKD